MITMNPEVYAMLCYTLVGLSVVTTVAGFLAGFVAGKFIKKEE